MKINLNGKEYDVVMKAYNSVKRGLQLYETGTGEFYQNVTEYLEHEPMNALEVAIADISRTIDRDAMKAMIQAGIIDEPYRTGYHSGYNICFCKLLVDLKLAGEENEKAAKTINKLLDCICDPNLIGIDKAIVDEVVRNCKHFRL